MQVLLIETSTEKSALVLIRDGKSLAIKNLIGGPDLSRCLADELQELLSRHFFRPEMIVVGQGPGSFTGIRVGMSLGQTLAYGWGISVKGFVSLKAFAPDVQGDFAVLFDARSGGFYALIGKKSGESIFFNPPFLLPESCASEVLKGIDQIASPHPRMIQIRFKEAKNWFETEPDPNLLAHLIFTGQIGSPEPLYLSNP